MRLRPDRLLVLASCAPLLAAACTSDFPAPDCYNDDCQITGASQTATSGGTIALDCMDIPNGALEAQFDYTPTVMGGDGQYSFAATGLPTGLSIDSVSGNIMGTPEVTGVQSIELTVTDGVGDTGMAVCEIDVKPTLDLELELLLGAPPYCVRPGATINDFVVDGTGDGTTIGCDSPGGNGNGDLPAGLAVDAITCQLSGALTETRYGTYVWIVRGTQSGKEVFIPYCDTKDTQEPGEYGITVDHSGLAGMSVDGTLVPIVRRFDPNANFTVGGGGDPRAEVTDPTSCGGNACFYGFAFSVNASPFFVDPGTLLDPNALLNNMAGDPIGFFHELTLTGPNMDAAPTFAADFGFRPWLVNLGIDYCIDAVEANCMGADNIRNNGNGGLEMSVVMFPQ